MISGCFDLPPKEQPFAAKDTSVSDYFSSLGYKVGWDSSHRLGERWHELYLDGELVAQIDMGIPLESIREDFIAWNNGGKSTSGHNYKVSAPKGKLFDDLLAKVAVTPASIQQQLF